ncbi:hypothetical protein D3C72_1422120 [compost metagenome]
MTLFVDLGQATQDGHRLIDRRFVQLHRLEAAGQGRVFLEVLLVLSPGGGGDGAQLATGQCRFEQVGRVGTASITARADQGVGFVDKQNDRLRRGLDLIDHALETTLELALHTGARLQQAHVQRQQLNILEHLRHFTGSDPRSEAFDHRSFTNAGFADHNRVVLTPPGEDVDHLAYRVITT